MNKKIVAIIPARGGSKGVPRKNIKPICGRPLIAWSIEAAKKSKYIDRVIVSTEDREIAEVAKQEGAEILWRPKKLATDAVPMAPVFHHAVQNISADIIILLQPTSPIRINNLIDRAIERFLDSGADSLATGFITHAYKWPSSNSDTPRQKLAGWFYDDGNIYIEKVDHLKKKKRFGKKIEKMIIDRYYNFEIDDEIDFFIVEALMKDYLKRIKTKR